MPTDEFIAAFNITDPAQVDLVKRWSELIGQRMRGEDVPDIRPGTHPLAHELFEAFGMETYVMRDKLFTAHRNFITRQGVG